MKRKKHIVALLILAMIFSLALSHLPVILTLLYHKNSGIPSARDASLSLPNLQDKKRIVIDGEWEFYWEQLIASEPVADKKADFLIRVPDYWSKYHLNGSYLPSSGYASYRLILKNLKTEKPVTVYIPDFGSAYRVFIDGKLTAESGIISKNTASVHTSTKAKLYPVSLEADEDHELIIEVATTRFSGLYMAPIITEFNSAIRNNDTRNSLRFLMFGVSVFSFFILLVGYVLSFRMEQRSVLLPTMGFFVLLRIMLTTEFFSFWQSTIFFGLSYEDANPLMFFVSFVFKYQLIFLAQDLLGIMFSKKEKLGLLIYYTVLYFLYLFIPHGFYNRHLTIILPCCAFLMEIYAFVKVCINYRQIKKYGLAIYFGTVLALTGLVIDCYYINGNIYYDMSLAMLSSLTVYLMILSLVSSIQASNIVRDYALSSVRLESVREQITMQTEYYNALSAQINEVRAIRHDFRHFISVLEQLLKEGLYSELDKFLGEYSKRADMEPLPIFCENVVANSILGYYSLKLKDNNICFQCSCAIPKSLSVTDSDLCIVLGNGLENAMEACQKVPSDEARFISVEARNVNNQFFIKITNTFDGIVKQEGSRFISTKDTPYHGIGLQNISKVVSANKNYIKTEYTDSLFTLMVAFPDALT